MPGPEPKSVFLQVLGPGWPHRGEWVGFWRGVRTRRWTYARWCPSDHGPVLFDRAADPYEMLNLVGFPAYADIQNELEAHLRDWLAQTADPFDLGRWDPETGMLDLGQEFTDPMYLTPGDYDHV